MKEVEKRMSSVKIYFQKEVTITTYLLGTVFFVGLIAASRSNFLVFHGVVEGFSAVIAISIFILGWSSKSFSENDYMNYLCISLLSIAFLDAVHTVTYKGMNMLENSGPNISTQFWIAGRYVQSISMFAAPFWVCKGHRKHVLLTLYMLLTVIIVYLIYYKGIFPMCYDEVNGELTTFKIVSEYVICLVYLAAMVAFYKRRDAVDSDMYWLIQISLMFSIFSELSFTLYKDVYGFYNVIGHFLKIVAFYLIYRAFIVSGLYKPHLLLFRELSNANKELIEERDKLAIALDDVKALKELLPICSGCKKIRDDNGYWTQLEQYMSENADIKFSHGMCPDCIKSYYPGFGEKKDT